MEIARVLGESFKSDGGNSEFRSKLDERESMEESFVVRNRSRDIRRL